MSTTNTEQHLKITDFTRLRDIIDIIMRLYILETDTYINQGTYFTFKMLNLFRKIFQAYSCYFNNKNLILISYK